MLPISISKINSVCCAAILILHVFCMAQYSTANDDLDRLDKQVQEIFQSLGIPQTEESRNNEKHIARALQAYNEALESDEETKELLKKWDNYLINVSHFSNANYTNAISKQVADYQKAIADLGDIIDKDKAKRKNEYSLLWIDDLINRFGKDYIKENREAISWSLLAVSTSDGEAFERGQKDLIYKEVMLYGSYKNYFGMFSDFYSGLDDQAKKKLEPRKNFADSFLGIIGDASLASITNQNVLRTLLTENKTRQLNADVFMFLKGHPLSHTLDSIRGMEDLTKAIEN